MWKTEKKNILSTLVRIPWHGTIVCVGVASGEPCSHGMPTKFLQKYCLLTIYWGPVHRATLFNTFGIIGLRPQASESEEVNPSKPLQATKRTACFPPFPASVLQYIQNKLDMNRVLRIKNDLCTTNKTNGRWIQKQDREKTQSSELRRNAN